MDAIREGVHDRLGDRAVIHCGTSAEVLTTFPDGYYDWIYIDGDHSEAAVRADLELAWRKVRAGGIIAGDDYGWARGGGVAGRCSERCWCSCPRTICRSR